MKTRIIAFACFVLFTAFVSETSAQGIPGPPPTCRLEVQKCQSEVEGCKRDHDLFVEWARQQCPKLTDGSSVQKTVKRPPNRRHKKPAGGKPQVLKVPPSPVKVATVLVPLYGKSEPVAPNATCPNGSFKLPVGFDKDGDKALDADEVVERLQSGCNGKDGAPGKPGKPGANARASKPERFASNSACPAGGTRTTLWSDLNGNGKMEKNEKAGDSVVCDGKAGSAGRPGANGDTRVQFGFGLRASAIWSKDRPIGISAAPEAQLELWLAPTVEFVAGVAWAPDGDRNMVVTGQLRHRALNKRLGLGLGIQYQAWNLEGNKALWQSVMGMASAQLVLVDSKWVDISVDAGLLLGLDGYDADAQFASGGTGGFTASLKF